MSDPDVHADQMDAFFSTLTTARELNMPSLDKFEHELVKSGPGTRNGPLGVVRDQRTVAAADVRAGAAAPPLKEAA